MTGCRCGKQLAEDGYCVWCGHEVTEPAPARPAPRYPAVPVLGGRRDRRRWTPELVAAAIRRWHRETGRTPRQTEWLSGGAWWPSSARVLSLFPTWKAAIVAAGLIPPAQGRPAMRKAA